LITKTGPFIFCTAYTSAGLLKNVHGLAINT